MTNARRRSNSSVETAKSFKSKYETIDQEPVFEEEIHGDGGINHYTNTGAVEEIDTSELEKQSSVDSVGSLESSAASVDMEAAAKPKA